jgi:hypothetical protein
MFSRWSNDKIAGRGRLRQPEIVLQKEEEQTSVINTVYCWRNKFVGGVIDTREQFITSVVSSVSSFSAVSLTPAINFRFFGYF